MCDGARAQEDRRLRSEGAWGVRSEFVVNCDDVHADELERALHVDFRRQSTRRGGPGWGRVSMRDAYGCGALYHQR